MDWTEEDEIRYESEIKERKRKIILKNSKKHNKSTMKPNAIIRIQARQVL